MVAMNGKPVPRVQAALEGSDRKSLAIGMNPAFLEIMEGSRIAHREQGGISPDKMRRHFGIKPKKAAKRRAAR